MKCPKCNGKANEIVEEAGMKGCFNCDFTGTLDGFRYIQEQHRLAYEAHDSENRAMEWDGFWLAFKARCRLGNERLRLSLAMRLFYTVKFAICFLLNLRASKTIQDEITVCVPQATGDGYAWHENSIVVGAGIFRGWEFELLEDGDILY